jgi:hypothetical protein
LKQKEAFNTVITLAEACERWGLDRKTIIWAYWNDRVSMKKSSRIWLVYVPDLFANFGDPELLEKHSTR